jgi:hypothetical protein
MTQQSLNPLLNEALEAHGGLERWRQFEGSSSTIVTGGRCYAVLAAGGLESNAWPIRVCSEGR